MSYQRIEAYRGWAIWQKDTLLDYRANMILQLEVSDVDIPDLKATIDEHMISKMAAFETKIKEGSQPEAVAPPPTRPLSGIEKRNALRTIGYITRNLVYLKTQVAPNIKLAEREKTLQEVVQALEAAVLADPQKKS